MSIEDVTIIYTCNYNSNIIIILVSPVLSSNEVDLLRYCTEVDCFGVYFLQSRFLGYQ